MIGFFSSPLTTKSLNFSEEVHFLDRRRSGGYFSEACKICTLKILLPFSTAYLKASFMKQTPDSDWWSENTTRTCRPWCFVCGTLTSCSFKYFCYIFLLLLCVLLAVFSWFGLQSAPRAQIHLEQKSFGQTGLDFPVSE